MFGLSWSMYDDRVRTEEDKKFVAEIFDELMPDAVADFEVEDNHDMYVYVHGMPTKRIRNSRAAARAFLLGWNAHKDYTSKVEKGLVDTDAVKAIADARTRGMPICPYAYKGCCGKGSVTVS